MSSQIVVCFEAQHEWNFVFTSQAFALLSAIAIPRLGVVPGQYQPGRLAGTTGVDDSIVDIAS